MMILFTVISFCLLITTIIVIINFFTAPVLKDKEEEVNGNPLVSVLIPARNEEGNIRACVESVLSQSYNNIEILTLDDNSTDETYAILNKLASEDTRIKLLIGKPLPTGWLGKNWACKQLADNAGGDLLLFIDADVTPAQHALNNALALMRLSGVKMLSSFPTQKINSVGEWLVVPLMNWILLTFLPLRKVYTSPNPKFAAANGQFIMFDKETYFAFGGHEAVKNKVVEDVEFVKLYKQHGEKVLTALGGDAVFCKMYSGFFGAFNGFTKNFYPGFGMHAAAFIFTLLFISGIYFMPVVLSIFNDVYLYAVFVIAMQRIILSLISGQNQIINTLLHPIHMLIMFLLGTASVIKTKSQTVKWKERKIY